MVLSSSPQIHAFHKLGDDSRYLSPHEGCLAAKAEGTPSVSSPGSGNTVPLHDPSPLSASMHSHDALPKKSAYSPSQTRKRSPMTLSPRARASGWMRDNGALHIYSSKVKKKQAFHPKANFALNSREHSWHLMSLHPAPVPAAVKQQHIQPHLLSCHKAPWLRTHAVGVCTAVKLGRVIFGWERFCLAFNTDKNSNYRTRAWRNTVLLSVCYTRLKNLQPTPEGSC